MWDFISSVPKKFSGKTIKILIWWTPGEAEVAKMKAFEEAKDEFSELMTRISAIISKSADGEDPDTAEPDHDCGGDCCTCGHCG